MTENHLLIRCRSSRTREPELDSWLRDRLARLQLQEAALYRSALFAGHPTTGQAPADWILALRSDGVQDSRQVAELLAELRLLGLEPELFDSPPARDRDGVCG